MARFIREVFSAHPLRSLRLCGGLGVDVYQHRRDAGNAEDAQREKSKHELGLSKQLVQHLVWTDHIRLTKVSDVRRTVA